MNGPEVEVLRHVNLFEDVHQPLLLCRLIYFVGRWYRDDLCILAVVKVMAAEKGHHRPLGDDHHIPSSGKLYESWGIS